MGLFGKRDYCKFVIITTPRTGSSFLASNLEKHSNVKYFGELFTFMSHPKSHTKKILKDPMKFLEKKVYKAYPSRIKAVGFKLFYCQLYKEHYFNDYFNNFNSYKDPLLKDASTKLKEEIE